MPDADLLHTALHDWHRTHGGRLVEFAGWSMPVQYSTIVEEHQAVRGRVGLFDIGHMGRLRVEGPGARAWLDYVTTNHVARLAENQIQYSLLANQSGGVLDDILIYRLPAHYLVVCNAANRERVIAQLQEHRQGFDARLTDQTLETAMIAVQGPTALRTLQTLVATPLREVKYYHSARVALLGQPALLSRTGYTGEDGFEIIAPRDAAESIWNALLDAGHDLGIKPCGLGARDTLRFEAAMPLYGHELSETINPYAAGVGWAVKLNKGEFIGRAALSKFKTDPGQTRIGLALEGKRIARQGCAVRCDGQVVGTVTSGTFSPSLGRSLAMALVDPAASASGTRLMVDVRGHNESALVTPLPFYRRLSAER
jgi:aminomethyltransferase